MNSISPTRVVGGRYVLLAEIGRGGMGVVWRAQDRVMDRQVAVKELHLPPRLPESERAMFRERLLREARTAGRLSHPGIVTVHDVLTDDGVDHLVMELIEAPTLDEVVRRDGPLDEARATALAERLLVALTTAHERGVVHRDVKPSNVMIDASGQVKLTDFGIAQAVDDPRLTATGAVVGSPAYLAPERIEGGPASPATDLWALGATLYHAVEGAVPFARESTAATFAAVLNAPAPPLTRTLGPVGSVITGLLQRDPRARLSGQQAMALLSGTATHPTAALPRHPTAVGGAPTPARGRRWPLVLAAALAGLLAGGLAGYLLAGGADGRTNVTTITYGPAGTIAEYATSGEVCLSGPLTPGRRYPPGSSVSCDGPHDLEVFATYRPFSGSEQAYPGERAFVRYGASACALAFASDLVIAQGKDDLEVVALVPTRAAYDNAGSSTGSVVCLLRARDGSQLTGARAVD